MIIQIPFKTPDTVDFALNDNNVPEEEQEDIKESLRQWIRCGEYVVLEYDTETDDISVKPAR